MNKYKSVAKILATLLALPLVFLATKFAMASILGQPAPAEQAGDFRALLTRTQSCAVLLGKASCPACQQLKAELKERGLAFQELDIDSLPPSEREQFLELGRGMIPMTLVADRVWVGYSPKVAEGLAQACPQGVGTR